MTTSPKVIFNCKFTHAFNRKEANYNEKKIEKVKKKIQNKFDYFSDENKRVMNLFDYYTGKINKEDTMNLVMENGKYATKEEIEKRKKQFVKYIEKSNLWQGVISFNNDYLNSNITIRELEKELVKSILPRFFKKMGFVAKDNMAYNLSVHTDTDNLHVHFSFMEKKPNYIIGDKVSYRKKGKLSIEEINFLKNEVAITIERKKYLTPMIKETNYEIEKLKTYFKKDEKNFILYDKNDLLLEDMILRLGEKLYKDNYINNDSKIKYNSIENEEIKKLTKEIRKYLFNSKNKFNNEYLEFEKTLSKINNYIKEINQHNNNSSKLDNSLTDYKLKYVESYILNSIVNYSKELFDEKSKKYKTIDVDTLLKLVILKEYKKKKDKSRYKILDNYFKNNIPKLKYQNKYEIINAIKSINKELEQAEEEFSKLFKEDKEKEINI